MAVDRDHMTELPLLAWKHGFHDEQIQVGHGIEVHEELQEGHLHGRIVLQGIRRLIGSILLR